ncbi:Phosphate-specific transport system accessory protein PhoU [bioreactor metagenome]|uniref:Phosphate-specific transport system accessory protein PhoU n=1 Tax=bioreactor metagenome TaxID=1076179 RepID=A0A645E4Q5_9ZZZZ
MSRKNFDAELIHLHEELKKMGDIVKAQISDSIKALVSQDMKLADEVVRKDDLVDDLEKEIEDKCIKLIATRQPLAIDLRSVFTMSKIVTDLERIADHAVDIAKIAKQLEGQKYIKELIDIPRMSAIVEEMIDGCLETYMERDVDLAYAVCKKDDSVDAIYKQIFSELLVLMLGEPKVIQQATRFLFVAKFLERMADHTTNICEWTIYLITGKKVDLND